MLARCADRDFTSSISFESNREQLLQRHRTPHYLLEELHRNGSFLDTKRINFRKRPINLHFWKTTRRSITIPTREHRHMLHFQFLPFLTFLPALPVRKHKPDIQKTSKIREQPHTTPQSWNPAARPYLPHPQLQGHNH